jgi:hypothetical protein
MIVRLQPSAEQVKHDLERILNYFETLDTPLAIEVTKRDIQMLILYLDSVNNAKNVEIFIVREGTQQRVGIKGFIEDFHVIY